MSAKDPTDHRSSVAAGQGPAGRPDGRDGGRGLGHERGWWTLHLWQIQGLRDVMFIAAVIGLVWLGYAMRSVTTPLLVALGLAYLFEPVIVWITRRWGLSRTTVVSSLLLMLVGGMVLTLALTAPLVMRQAASLVDDVRSGRLIRGVERLESLLPESAREPFHQFALRLGLADPLRAERDAAGLEAVQVGSAGAAEGEQAGGGGGTVDGAKAPAVDGNPAVAGAEGGASEREAEKKPRGGEGAPDPTHVATGAGDKTPAPHVRALIETEDERIRRIVREELLANPPHVLGPDAMPTGAGGRMTASGVVAVLRSGWDTAEAVVGFLLKMGLLSFLIPFYFFFFSVSYPAVQSFCESLIPRSNRERTLDLLRQMDAAVAGFVRGRVVISAIVGFVLAIGWLIVGVPYSIVLGIVVGVFNLVPYLSGVGLPIAVGLMVFAQLGMPEDQRTWLWAIGAPTAIFFLAQILDGYVLTPVIAGKATNLDPVTIFVAVLAGGSLGGVYGMLLAIPVAACLKIALRELLLPRVKQWVEGRAKDPLPM